MEKNHFGRVKIGSDRLCYEIRICSTRQVVLYQAFSEPSEVGSYASDTRESPNTFKYPET